MWIVEKKEERICAFVCVEETALEPAVAQEKRNHAEQLIREGYYSDALSVLDALVRNRGAKSEGHGRWAKEQIPKVRARLKKARAECRDACILAEQLFEQANYREAVELLEKFKRGSRSTAADELMADCKRTLKRIAKLNEKIDEALHRQETDTDEFFDLIEDVLELDPKDQRARQFYRKLQAKQNHRSNLGLRFALAAVCLICLALAIWLAKVFLFDEAGTITITLKEPGYEVYVDGELLPAEDLDVQLDRFDEGTHRVQLRQNSRVVFNYEFAIEDGEDIVLAIPSEADLASLEPPPIEERDPSIPLDGDATDPLDPMPVGDDSLIGSVDPAENKEDEKNKEDEPDVAPEPEEVEGFPIAQQAGYLHLKGEPILPSFVAFSSDASRVAAERITSDAGAPKKTYDVTVWSTASGDAIQTVKSDAGLLQGLALSPDGKTLALGFASLPEPMVGSLQLWTTETGELRQTLPLTIPPSQETVEIKDVRFSPDGKFVGIINQDSIFVWQAGEGKLVTQKSFAPAELTTLGFFPGNQIVIVGAKSSGNDGVLSWDMQRNVQRGFLSASGGFNGDSYPLFANSPDLSVITVLNGQSLRRYAVPAGRYLSGMTLPRIPEETGLFREIRYSPSGRFVMASAPGRRPLVWRDSDLDKTAILGERASVGAYAAVFSADSRTVLQFDLPDQTDPEICAAVVRIWEIPQSPSG